MKPQGLFRIFSAVLIFIAGFSFASAQDLIAIGKAGNVYDEASAKYITVNQNNDDVAVIPGMVFPFSQHSPGWYKIEYSPGIHAFIPDQIVSSNFTTVVPGTYEITNNPGHKLVATQSGETWQAVVDGQTYSGKEIQDIILFTDPKNTIAFSLVDLGNGPIAISYDNSVTKFF